MATIRINKDKNYVVLNNTALNDDNLSFKAKGIFAYLMSKPDDWKCKISDLKKHAKDGTDSIRAGLRELREHGYMIKRPIKNKNNVIIEWEEVLFETPQLEAKEIFENQEIKRIKSLEKRRQKATSGNSTTGENNKKSTTGFSTTGFSISGKPSYIINTNIQSIDKLNTNISSSPKENKEEDTMIINSIINEVAEKGYKLTKQQIKKLINLYGDTKTLKAINTCLSVDTTINNFYAYVNATLNDLEKTKTVNISSDKNNKSNFNNFDQREYDFNDLEKKLLGWSEE